VGVGTRDGLIRARDISLSNGLEDLFSLSELTDAAGDGDIDGTTLELRVVRLRSGSGDASYIFSSNGAGDSDILVDLAMLADYQ
jgi:hypothetical protein